MSRVSKIEEGKICPICGRQDHQQNRGHNASGTRRCYCTYCKKIYTLDPKKRAYSDEKRELAMKIYYSGVSGRQVGRILGMNKANVYNWIKKRIFEST